VSVASWVRSAGRVVLSPRARADALHEVRRRRRGEPALPARVERIVVICHGNICRSPFAAALLAARRPELAVRSAGLEAVDGRPAEEAARRVARAFGLELAAHRARRLSAEDAAWADLVVGMEGHHAARVHRAFPGAAAKTVLLGDFLPAPPFRIADPWGCEDAVFEATFERIRAAVERLAARLAERGA